MYLLSVLYESSPKSSQKSHQTIISWEQIIQPQWHHGVLGLGGRPIDQPGRACLPICRRCGCILYGTMFYQSVLLLAKHV